MRADLLEFAPGLRCVGGHGRLAWRAETFFTEERQTIEWLDGIGKGDVLWDVGANVGLYSLYAAKRGAKVVAFEPESQNYALLCENIALNGLGDLVQPCSIALGAECGVAPFYVKEISRGIAHSQLSEVRPSGYAVRQLVGVATIDDLRWSLPMPDYIKLDVDGEESAILTGAWGLLSSGPLRSILIEIDLSRPDSLAIPKWLTSLGFNKISQGENEHKGPTPTLNYVFARAA